jgi:zinc transporter, ZIP family
MMIDYWQLLVLGSIAGFTIFLGLPLAVLQNINPKKKGFLNAFAIGILLFLIIDVFSHAWESVGTAAQGAFAGKSSFGNALFGFLAMFGGLAVGLLGLVFYESRYMKHKSIHSSTSMMKSFAYNQQESSSKNVVKDDSDDNSKTGIGSQQEQQLLFHETYAYRLSTMIAIGIGAHNFSEGLAIGQSYISGAIGLAILLIIGFGTHNATEGFGIAGPLTGMVRKPRIRFLIMVGLIGGCPTFVGTITGSLWNSAVAYVLFLSIAGGALVYVSMLMYNSCRRHTTNNIVMLGIFAGMCAGFLTDFMVTLGGA